ncbi:serine/threonine-protein kinase [Kineosporia sp. A_224]|uniref:serine/threonine-protein kinase n=1 Tax=Kineosporia sp. A_224 TaxID=1962180 RepID=UPI000B4C11A6|nr:serine/threonine-protein kinase [Kineosporia sp. A_224]
MSAQRCTQPGCTGTILDGYCDVCGMPAPVGAGGASAVGGAVPGAAAPARGASSLPSSVPLPPTSLPASSAPVGPTSSTRSSVTSSSNRLASAPIGSVRAKGTRATRKVGTSSTRLRGARLGAGLTTIPPIPEIDPNAAIMKNPQVPEDRRYCPSCGKPVGRTREGRPGRTEGFCPNCRTPFDFAPKLKPGDLVAGQYEVAGCLAHGGLGWIYMARDKNVSDRWVVLKGLLNSGDPDAYAAAVAERQFLAQVTHPLIVEIYNFVLHEGAGYIVMEYVGGTSLKSILKDRMRAAGGRYDAIPVDQAIAYLVEILPAFQYLHDLGLIYCDFKPDNMIQVGDAVKLIDMGGVRRIGDMDSAIYGTVGYQAPEVPDIGPSIASDIYTIGRTLTVLVMEFRGYQSTYVASLPPVADVPVFAAHDSLYRLLAKACAPDPADRFQSADELRVQLLGVLREIVAAAGDASVALHSAPSVLFEAPVVSGDDLTWEELPALRVDTGDRMASWLAALSVADPAERVKALHRAPEETVEIHLATARAAVEAGRYDIADGAIAKVLADDPWEWRAVWLQGLAALAKNDAVAARASFNAVYGQVPGELAPKLALGLACETSGESDVAQSLYATCARTDANYTAPAAFGLCRLRRARGDLDGALAALDLVPSTSRAFVEARRQRAGLLAASGRGLNSLAAAMDSISAVTIDPLDRARLTANVLDVALAKVLSDGADEKIRIDGHAATEPHLRDGLESAYRQLAQMSDDGEERVRLVDQANRVRRWTLR